MDVRVVHVEIHLYNLLSVFSCSTFPLGSEVSKDIRISRKERLNDGQVPLYANTVGNRATTRSPSNRYGHILSLCNFFEQFAF